MADESDNAPKPPKLVWLTTMQVRADYGFDPTRYLTDREPVIQSKLAPINVPGVGMVTQRVWLQSDVVAHPEARLDD